MIATVKTTGNANSEEVGDAGVGVGVEIGEGSVVVAYTMVPMAVLSVLR